MVIIIMISASKLCNMKNKHDMGVQMEPLLPSLFITSLLHLPNKSQQLTPITSTLDSQPSFLLTLLDATECACLGVLVPYHQRTEIQAWLHISLSAELPKPQNTVEQEGVVHTGKGRCLEVFWNAEAKVGQLLRIKLNGGMSQEKIAGSGKGEQRNSYPQLSSHFWVWPTLTVSLFSSSFFFGCRVLSWRDWGRGNFATHPPIPLSPVVLGWGGRNYSRKLAPLHITQLLFFIEIYFWQVIWCCFQLLWALTGNGGGKNYTQDCLGVF